MSIRNLLLILVVAAVGAASVLWWMLSQSAAEPELHPAIEQIRKAVSPSMMKNSNTHFVLQGNAMNAGTNGTYRITFNGDGRFNHELATPISYATGFDGKKGWRMDWSHLPSQLELHDLVWERLMVSIQTGQWVQPQSPYISTFKSESDGELLFDISFKHNDAFHAELFVDATSNDPLRLVQLSGRGHEVLSMTNYQDFDGLRLPTLITIETGGIERVRYELQDVSSTRNANYAMPTERPSDATFDTAVAASFTLKRAATGHLLIRPIVNGKELDLFVFDSGAAVSVISREAAAQLGLSKLGEIPLVSILGVEAAPVYQLDTVQLGPLTVEGPMALEMDLAPFSAAFGQEVYGVLGYDLLARAVIEVELASNTMWIHDPATYQLPSGKWTELFLDTQHPIVSASMPQGDDLLFRLDLGSQLGLTIHTPWVDKLNLLDGVDYTPTPLTPNINGAVVELPWFELAGQRFDNIQTFHILSDVPPLNDRATTGNIGLQLLNGFRIVFNYPNKKIAFLQL